jgi:integrase
MGLGWWRDVWIPNQTKRYLDDRIARACRNATKLAKLNYDQANRVPCHSLRHTFVTDMMEATGK